MQHFVLINTIKSRAVQPVNYIFGGEPLFIDEIINAAEKYLLTEAERSFNQTVVYGRDITIPSLIDICKRYPMMSEKQVVIVKEAQFIKDKDWELMMPYFEKPTPTTILFIANKTEKLDERKTITKSIRKTCAVFNAEKIKDWKLTEWVRDYTRHLQYEISPEATQLLCDHVGNNLSTLVNELTKIIINSNEKRKIGVKEIELYVGISNDYSAFEMLKAIAKKDKIKAFQIAEVLSAQPLVMVLTTMFAYFAALYCCHIYQVTNQYDAAQITGRPPNIAAEYLASMSIYPLQKTEYILLLINKYDLKEKGVGNSKLKSKELLPELIAKIFSM